MTREKAIEILKRNCYGFNPLNFDRTYLINTALDMAIEALEQKPCDDCISRAKTCDYIAEFINHEYSTQSECEMVDAMIEGIHHLPSVKQEQKPILDKVSAAVEKIETYDGLYVDRAYVLEIIDNYKAESEG